MTKITFTDLTDFIRHLSDFQGAVRNGFVYHLPVVQRLNECKMAVGAVVTAVVVTDGQPDLLECEMAHGMDIDRNTNGSKAAAEAYSALVKACDDMHLKLRTGKIEFA